MQEYFVRSGRSSKLSASGAGEAAGEESNAQRANYYVFSEQKQNPRKNKQSLFKLEKPPLFPY